LGAQRAIFAKIFCKVVFRTFQGELSTIWVLRGRFSRKFSEKSFFALFRAN
ncbi:hypothetical protein T11_18108, partial [Trichinella zimbabwensis]